MCDLVIPELNSQHFLVTFKYESYCIGFIYLSFIYPQST